MCLIRNKERERQLRQRLSKSRRITAYKAMNLRNGFVESFWYPANHLWKPGWNMSNRLSMKCGVAEDAEVKYGIHVYLRRNDALRTSCLVLPVQCQRSDFVAAGWDTGMGSPSAVFHKVFVKKADWQAAERFDA